MRLTSLNATIYATAVQGTTVDGGVIGPAYKPDTNPTTNWNLLGNNTKVSITNNTEVYTSSVGVNGSAVPIDEITTKKGLAISMEFETLSNDILTWIFQAKKIGETTTYKPFDACGNVKMWVKIQAYNSCEAGAVLFAADLYVSLKPDAMDITVGEAQKYTLSGQVLYSDLNVLDIPATI